MILSRSAPRQPPPESDSTPICEYKACCQSGYAELRATTAACRTNHLSSFLERFGVNLNQDHSEIFIRGAAPMRSTARHDDEISFLDFNGLAIDDPRTAPLARVVIYKSAFADFENLLSIAKPETPASVL